MIGPRLAAALLALAARRWPVGLRDDMHREWSAELHVLADEGRPARMVGYAFSLAVSRPAADPLLDRSRMTKRFWATAATVLLMPVLCFAVLIVTAIGANLVAAALGWRGPAGEQMSPLFTALCCIVGVLLGLLATRRGARTALRGRVRLAVALVLPSVVAIVLVINLLGSAEKVVRVVPELLWWSAGMVAVLWAAGSLAARGRVTAAWWVGVLGAFLVADVAIAITVFGHTGPPEYIPLDYGQGVYDGVSRVWAPLWLPTMYTGGMHGLPGPTSWEVAQVGDATEFTPYVYLVFGAYLLAYAIGAGRGEPVQAAADSVPPSPDSPTTASVGSGSGSGSISA
ncbi:hypothetical protein [Catellatospora tritici]|uniref:hypothetical protein n=1 Tax=Catellatospora tritici TaxID=2851566 RepID=UPI001C2D2EA3|nr:hypothetical protein [Catellatospora tritici]MBV1851532.1 hypothetical protein [Catellatospora tritici]